MSIIDLDRKHGPHLYLKNIACEQYWLKEPHIVFTAWGFPTLRSPYPKQEEGIVNGIHASQ